MAGIGMEEKKRTRHAKSKMESEGNGPLRRHRSFNEHRNKTGREGRSASLEDDRPRSPVHCFLSELNFTKVNNQLISNPSSRKTALLLQALRQARGVDHSQITMSSSKEYAREAIDVLSEKDVLSLRHRKHSAVATILMNTENGHEVKEQLIRFLNALASFSSGRKYLIAVGGTKEVLSQLLSALRSRRLQGSEVDHIVATLQKLSISSLVCRDLLLLGIFEWLLPSIEASRLSTYGTEFAAALLLNLTLSSNSPALLSRYSDQLLSALAALLRLKNTTLCTVINGAVYAAFAFGRIRARARETRFEVHLQAKLDRADCTVDILHIPFLLKQMKGESEMIRITTSAGEELEDTSMDSCESEIESTDHLKAHNHELSGAKLLLAKVLRTPMGSMIESMPGETERADEITAPPGTVQRMRKSTDKRGVSGGIHGHDKNTRLNSATSHVTFTIEGDSRRPLIQPIALSQQSYALKRSEEKCTKENVMENTEEKSARSWKKGMMKREKNKGKISPHNEEVVAPPKEPNSSPTKSAQKKERKDDKSTDRDKEEKKLPSSRQALKIISRVGQKSTKRTPNFSDQDNNCNQIENEEDSALDYMAVFGSRPKILRTPDKDKNSSLF